MSEFQTRDGSQVASSPAQTPFQLNPIASYFALTFAISWRRVLGCCSKTPHGEVLPKLTRIVDGTVGLRDLVSRGTRFRVPLHGMRGCWFLPSRFC